MQKYIMYFYDEDSRLFDVSGNGIPTVPSKNDFVQFEGNEYRISKIVYHYSGSLTIINITTREE